MKKETMLKMILDPANANASGLNEKTDSFLVKSVSNGLTSKGAKYLSLTLQDRSGETVAKFWDPTEQDLATVVNGVFVMVRYYVSIYGDKPQMTIKEITDVQTINAVDNVSDYVITTPLPLDDLKRSILREISGIQNTVLKSIVMSIFKDVGANFMQSPAAKSVHHNYYGGLAQHSLEMCQLAHKICEVFTDLNVDLIVSGALLHDIAKTIELSGAIGCDYTDRGKLLGHISMAQAYIFYTAKKLGVDNTDECLYLQHMVLSHHGQLEFGSPVQPCFREAMILNQIDGISAKYNTMTKALEDKKPGEWSDKIYALGHDIVKIKI